MWYSPLIYYDTGRQWKKRLQHFCKKTKRLGDKGSEVIYQNPSHQKKLIRNESVWATISGKNKGHVFLLKTDHPWGTLIKWEPDRGEMAFFSLGWLWEQSRVNSRHWKSRHEDIDWWWERVWLPPAGDISKQLGTNTFPIKCLESSGRCLVIGW